MGILSVIGNFFTGGGISAIERIASEAIETDKESAEAKTLILKTLDPNGKMRRDLAKFASQAYKFYLIAAVFLIVMHFFGIGDPTASKEALTAITDLFLPITSAWGAIVTASFGVNYANVKKGI